MLQPQKEQINNQKGDEGIRDVAKSKLRYIAGACIHNVIGRLQTNVLKRYWKRRGGTSATPSVSLPVILPV